MKLFNFFIFTLLLVSFVGVLEATDSTNIANDTNVLKILKNLLQQAKNSNETKQDQANNPFMEFFTNMVQMFMGVIDSFMKLFPEETQNSLAAQPRPLPSGAPSTVDFQSIPLEHRADKADILDTVHEHVFGKTNTCICGKKNKLRISIKGKGLF